MVSPLVRSRYVNSVGLHPCNPAIFHVAQSDEILLSFSLLATATATEKTRRAVCTEFPLSGYIP
ncbi:TPA: hypothetical protein JD053_17110 [Klebsiella michiganensis]|uniref:Uncharacterized protein n=7 Tax=Enterobacteriaceae TaxID=543 RepID=A0A746KNI3_SALER|nr:hypothetical protein CI104_26475 [Citrobacter farmeri]AVU53380.1 hypothetical protein AXJ76_25715 [Enterobacter cloacae]AWD11669.1 hypothetical protein C7D56_26125 [Salmonella enterica subsp. enterica serovar Corvallis]AWR71598.1 hypothetical protein CUN65_25325 [Enterobacter hormaechei subsp. xiangfangensis]EAA1316145.1 hypothetical protein [Salmonella enterica subsp. enterica serovar Java]EAA7802044.1 hypothetical protein [Salmonella enterica subsp. enterica serovar Heidelberg]EAM1169231